MPLPKKIAVNVKAILRSVLPAPTHYYATQIYRNGLECIQMLRNARRLGVPKTLIHFGIAPGDDLLCTAVLHELTKRGHHSLWMMSDHPEIFNGNPDVARVVPIEWQYRDFALRWRSKYHLLDYGVVDFARDITTPPERHIIGELCQRSEILGEIALRPYFYLRDNERLQAEWAKGSIAIQSSGLSAKFPMKNKQWFPGRFQEVVNAMGGELDFIQVGSADDPALTGVTDLRGKTGIRETAAILANCRLFVGNVGFLMHLARAVECRSVILYGGREAPWQSGYNCNVNLYSGVSCSPCWLWNRCEYGRICMTQITADHVIEAIGDALGIECSALEVDRILL